MASAESSPANTPRLSGVPAEVANRFAKQMIGRTGETMRDEVLQRLQSAHQRTAAGDFSAAQGEVAAVMVSLVVMAGLERMSGKKVAPLNG